MEQLKTEAQKESDRNIAQALHYLAREIGHNDPLHPIISFIAEMLEQRHR